MVSPISDFELDADFCLAGLDPSGDVHNTEGRGVGSLVATFPKCEEKRDGRPRLLHVQSQHPVRLGGLGRTVLCQVRSKPSSDIF